MKAGSVIATAAMLVSVLWGAAAAAEVAAPQAVICHPIRQAAQLLKINDDPAATYCLLRDIDAGQLGVLNASPIPNFSGRLFGNGHAIRNLTIDSSEISVGLFGTVDGALIQDLRLVNVNVISGGAGGNVGGLAALVGNASAIARVAVSGRVGCLCFAVGGIVGQLAGGSTLAESSSAAAVASANIAGGAVGFLGSGASIIRTHATGAVEGSNAGGGLVGQSQGLVDLSGASGRVGGGSSGSGGLVGFLGGTVRRSHASGPVSGTLNAGGLVGGMGSGTIEQSYAVGRVTGGPDSGGLVGDEFLGTNTVTSAYWDTVTTRQATSAVGGTGLTTGQLRAGLPGGFGSDWGITANKSYPFLDDPDISLILPLATLARGGRVYTLVPIGQNDASQYAAPPQNERLASLATVYTMIARAIGMTRDIADLSDATITDFWDDATATATWQGPVTTRAMLGTLTDIPDSVNLGHGNVIDEIRRRNLVILRGSYTAPNGNVRTHWMLATLYALQPSGKPGLLVANDPWTGAQVFIDRKSKHVVLPADFPLADFRIDGYQPVTVQ